MKTPIWDLERAAYDRFKASHMLIDNNSMVLFDTGELIYTDPRPDPGQRHNYSEVSVAIYATTDEPMPTLYLPNGDPVAKAWLDDGGQQHLMVDREMNRAVRIDGPYRRKSSSGKMPPLIEGIPHRFQEGVFGYIGGPGCNPIGTGKIAVHQPIKKWLTPEELEHCNMIETTFRAAAKLTDHECIRQSSMNRGIAAALLLKCQTWQDIPADQMAMLYHNGISKKREFNWLAVSS